MARKKSTDGMPKGGAKKRTPAQIRKAHSTPFCHGNTLWMARSTHGRNPIFKTADELLDAVSQYFQWVEQNPLKEQRVAQSDGQPILIDVDRVRALTIGGMCLFIGIGRRTWDDWKSENTEGFRLDFLPVIEFAEEAIREQKFSAAAAGLLNANIISRDLGLVDRSERNGEQQLNINLISNYSDDN